MRAVVLPGYRRSNRMLQRAQRFCQNTGPGGHRTDPIERKCVICQIHEDDAPAGSYQRLDVPSYRQTRLYHDATLADKLDEVSRALDDPHNRDIEPYLCRMDPKAIR